MADLTPPQRKSGILGQTLGQLLQNNPHAQGMIMQSMQITPEQFKQLLNTTGDNPLMQMTIGELFKRGIVTQAMQQNSPSPAGQAVQIPPQQVQQILNAMPATQTQQDQMGTSTPIAAIETQTQKKHSFWQKLQKLWGG